MKIALLGDPHLTYKYSSYNFKKYFELFYNHVFFPYLLQHSIDIIICVGDLFHNRKHTCNNGFFESVQYFFEPLKQFTFYTLLGNHDIYYKESLKINTPSLLLPQYNNIIVIDSPKYIEELDIDLIPWVCKENYIDVINWVQKSKASVCVGHFEFKDFCVSKGIEMKEGLDHKLFDRYEYVFSGHFHHKSHRDNVYYLGTNYQLTWNDFNDIKGFHVFDTETRNLEFIENPYTMFHKIFYDGNNNEILEKYTDTIVKLIIKEKTNEQMFETFYESLQKVNPLDLSVVDENIDITEKTENIVDETQDTLTIINDYISNMIYKDIDNDKLKMLMNDIYTESLTIE